MRSNRIIAAISIASVSVGIAVAFGQSGQPERQPPDRQGPPGRQPEGRGGRQGEPPNVEASMKSMNRALQQLRDQLGDASKKDSSLKLIGDAQRGCIAAKSGQPQQIAEMKDDAAKAKSAESFRRQLMALARKLLDIEQSLLDGKHDEAKAQLTEVIKMRDAGHAEFGVE